MAETNGKLKVIVFGAGGNTGRCLVRAGLALGHEVSAFVRDARRLRAVVGDGVLAHVRVYEGDALDEQAVAAAMAGHHAAVNVAQHPDDARIFEGICRNVVAQAEKHLLEPRRLWLFGGLPGLDVPHTNTIGSDLPGMRPILRSHKANYRLLLDSDLDWSFMCPGPMAFSITGRPNGGLRVTTETMPYDTARWTRWLPKIAHPFIMLRRMDQLVVSYEDVAHFVMSNLQPNGPYHRKRVGLAVMASPTIDERLGSR